MNTYVFKFQIIKRLKLIGYKSCFFLSGFSFTKIHDSQGSRRMKRVSIYLLSKTSTLFTDNWTLAGKLLQRAHLCIYPATAIEPEIFVTIMLLYLLNNCVYSKYKSQAALEKCEEIMLKTSLSRRMEDFVTVNVSNTDQLSMLVKLRKTNIYGISSKTKKIVIYHFKHIIIILQFGKNQRLRTMTFEIISFGAHFKIFLFHGKLVFHS